MSFSTLPSIRVRPAWGDCVVCGGIAVTEPHGAWHSPRYRWVAHKECVPLAELAMRVGFER